MAKNAASKVLIAEDNKATRRLLEMLLGKWGYEVIAVVDGNEAWEQLKDPDSPKLAILDWMMPGMDGIDVCRKVREINSPNPPYIIMLTSRNEKEDMIEGLKAGANDFIPKPHDNEVLRARLEVGHRAVELQNALVDSDKSNEKVQMEQTIIALKKQAEELEKRLDGYAKGGVKTSSPETGANILEEIVVIFKRGEINLPSPPQIGIKFKEMVSSGANLQQIAHILKQDVAISSKLISISNSAFYRGVAENKSLDQAVGRLGLTATKQFVDAITNRSLYFTKDKNFKELVETLWEHSLSCAYASQAISEMLKLKLQEDAFTLGLFHDIGRLVLLQAVGELQRKKKIGKKITDDELFDTIDQNHGKFGAALLKTWKFSGEYVQVAVYHDQLQEADNISKDLLVVHMANLLVKSMGYSTSGNGEIDLEKTESATLLKLDSATISSVKDRVKTQMEEMKDCFS